jgi:hypothetical protein
MWAQEVDCFDVASFDRQAGDGVFFFVCFFFLQLYICIEAVVLLLWIGFVSSQAFEAYAIFCLIPDWNRAGSAGLVVMSLSDAEVCKPTSVLVFQRCLSKDEEAHVELLNTFYVIRESIQLPLTLLTLFL